MSCKQPQAAAAARATAEAFTHSLLSAAGATTCLLGTLGECSTPELLAKRAARQQQEREAAAAARGPSFARRLLQPLQPQQQQHVAAGGHAAAPAAAKANPFSRKAKRPLGQDGAQQQQPDEPTGVSAEQLAKVRSVAAEQRSMRPALA